MDSKFITVTGIDEKTDLEWFKNQSFEIGILYSATPEGRNRYPSKEWIVMAGTFLSNFAVHICGKVAREELFKGKLTELLLNAKRIQINGKVSVDEIETACDMFRGKTIITQYNDHNKPLVNVKTSNHALLVDRSGGRGISPESWETVESNRKSVGYAGGLNPENLFGQLCSMPDFTWVDMENGIREDDWFSVNKVKQVLEAFNKWKMIYARYEA